MTVVNLGARPNTGVIHTGDGWSAQGWGSGEVGYTNMVAPGLIPGAPGGGGFGLTLYGHAEQAIALCMATNIVRCADPIWANFIWGMKLYPADLNGQSESHCYFPVHSHQSWQMSRVMHAFHIGAGAYTLYQYFFGSTNHQQIIYTGPEYQQLHVAVTSVGRL